MGRERMWFPKLSVLLFLFVLFSLSQTPATAIKKSYIVYLGGHSHGPEVSTADLVRVTDSHNQFLGSFLGSTDKAKDAIFYSYRRHINGFAASLEEEDAAEIAKHPRVLSVFPNNRRKLHTTHSWDFMLLDKNGVVPSSSALARFGEDTIIGTLDTGVWPESESFSDEGYGPIPSRWKGVCQNNTKGRVLCNRKLIGARYFIKGFIAESVGSIDPSIIQSPRDYEGHGSHTLSTAGGNFVPKANVFGFGNGTARGGSPRARVASYKVCWPSGEHGGCSDADILEAFDLAIHDGVDVISGSLGDKPKDYLEDSLSIGAFHAIKNGIIVVCSAGNSGPSIGSVSNVSPWIITVGASTMDREFASYVKLHNGLHFKGESLSNSALPENRFYPLISGEKAKADNATANDAILCKKGTLDPKKVKGKILACLRGTNGRVNKGQQAALAGAVGMILCNDFANGNQTNADVHVLPASHISYANGLAVFAYINSTDDPLGFLTAPATKVNTKPAPIIASFSSRGPNTVTPEILKPDITAPGVNIIAAYTLGTSATNEVYDKRKVQYNVMSGTSMACPHVAGVVGLLKTLYPDWSPAAIRSAIMTTAKTRDNTWNPITDENHEKATPFSYGAGHIRPNRAVDPGLVFDLAVDDYLNFLCALGYNTTHIEIFSGSPNYRCPRSTSVRDLNYPSIAIPNLSSGEIVRVSRTVKNVGSPGTYAARVRAPAGISVTVEPNVLKFDTVGEEKSFKLVLKAKKIGSPEDYAFGMLIWSDGTHYVRSPIVVNAAPVASSTIIHP